MSPTALIIGAGYLGSNTVLPFLDAGYAVRLAVRSQAKADAWLARSPHIARRNVTACIVPDAATPGALAEAMRGVKVVVNQAGMIPKHWSGEVSSKAKEGLDQVLAATLEPMKTAALEPSIKRFIYIATSFDVGKGIDERSWADTSIEKTLAAETVGDLYMGTKTIAEKAAVDWTEQNKPSFDLIRLLPTRCLGPRGPQIVDPQTPYFGNVGKLERLLTDPDCDFDTVGFAAPRLIVDVRDVATATVRAASDEFDPAKAGKRFLLVGPRPMSDVEIVQLIHSKLGPDKLRNACRSIPENEERGAGYVDDGTLAERMGLVSYRPVEQTVLDTAAELLHVDTLSSGAKAQPTVLIVGNGYIASNLVEPFLDAGYAVRITARSQQKADAWLAKSPSLAERHLRFYVVPNADMSGALAEAMRGCSVVVNTVATIPPRWFLDGVAVASRAQQAYELTRDATIEPLKTAAQEPALRRFIYLASGCNLGAEGTTERDWKATSEEDILRLDDYTHVYQHTKTMGEKVALSWVEDHKPAFELLRVLPTRCIGPRGPQTVEPKLRFFDNVGQIDRLLSDREADFDRDGRVKPRLVVDVRDVAQAIVNMASPSFVVAAEPDKQRFMLCSPRQVSDVEILDLIRHEFGVEVCRYPSKQAAVNEDVDVDGTYAERLGLITYRPIEQTIVDMAAELLHGQRPVKREL